MKIKRTPLTNEQKEFARKLKSIWKKKKIEFKNDGINLTQEYAAAKLGFDTQGAVSQYLNGASALNDATILKFSKLLNINPGEVDPKFNSFVNKAIQGNLEIKEQETDGFKADGEVVLHEKLNADSENVYVLWWKYRHEGSPCIISVFKGKQAAEQIRNILEEHGDEKKDFFIHNAPFVK